MTEGVSSAQIGQQLRTALFGLKGSKIKVGKDEYKIRIRNLAVQRKNLSDLLNMNITFRDIAPGGQIKNVPISSLVHIDYTNTLGSVKRKIQKRVITLKSNVLNGYTAPAVNVQLAREIGDFKKKPDGVTITQTGGGAQQAETTAFLGNALLIALFFIGNNNTYIEQQLVNLKRIEIMNESILITGANAGLGKEAARQLALKKETKKVILFCRNQVKAEAAKKDLEEQTGKKLFEIIIGDVAHANSVRKAVEKIKEPIGAVILNAGGVIGKTAGKITPSGMNELAATNILGNVILVEELIERDLLKKTVLSVSAEAVPGVKMLGMKPVAMKTSSVDEFAAVLDGSYFGNKFEAIQAYGYVKYAVAMWTLSMARKYPDLKFVAMSPGNTKGTGAPDSLPPAMKFMLNYFMMPIVFPLIGAMVHTLEVGAKRFVDGISDESYKSGVFYSSKEGKLSGDVVDQSTFYTDLKNTSFQDNAYEAIHRFIK